MQKPTQPYTKEELARIEEMVQRGSNNPMEHFSEELNRELAEFRIICEHAEKFMHEALAFLNKYNGKQHGELPADPRKHLER